MRAQAVTFEDKLWQETNARRQAKKGKKCSRCSKIAGDVQFAKHGRSKDGLQGWCQECLSRFSGRPRVQGVVNLNCISKPMGRLSKLAELDIPDREIHQAMDLLASKITVGELQVALGKTNPASVYSWALVRLRLAWRLRWIVEYNAKPMMERPLTNTDQYDIIGDP